MFRSIPPCPSLRFPILPAQSCRKIGRASPRIEGSSALGLRCLDGRPVTREAVLCLQTGRTLSCQPRPLCRLPDGRGRHSEKLFTDILRLVAELRPPPVTSTA